LSGARERNVALAREGLDAFNRGDTDAVLEFFDPRIECYVSPRLMNAGTWHGLDGYLEMVAGWNEAWDELELDVRDVQAVDDAHVIAEIHQTAVGRESRVPVELGVVFLWEVSDTGRTVRFHIHADRESALAAI
jgi:ketosteroid isomerase-like protein